MPTHACLGGHAADLEHVEEDEVVGRDDDLPRRRELREPGGDDAPAQVVHGRDGVVEERQ